MPTSKLPTLCAIVLFITLFAIVNNAAAGKSGGSHAVSAPQQKSVRKSTDIKLPNKPPVSRKPQKRDAAAVKTQAGKQVDGDYHKATTVVKNSGVRLQSNTDYLKSAIGAQGKTMNTKQQDDLEKQKQAKQKELKDQREQEAKEHGLENKDTEAAQQAQQRRDDQNPLSDPIGYVEKQLKDGTSTHNPQPSRSDNFTQDANDFAKGASQYGEVTKGGTGHGFGEINKEAMDKATKDDTPARLRQCANC